LPEPSRKSLLPNLGFLLPVLVIFTVLFGILYYMAPELAGERTASLRAWILMLWVAGVIALVVARRQHRVRADAARAHIETVLTQLAEEKPGVRIDADQAGNLRFLAHALNQAAASLETRLQKATGERDELTFVLSAMEDGVVVVDANRRVRLINAAAQRILDCSDDAVLGRALQEFCRTPELLENSDRAITKAETSSVEFQSAADINGVRRSLMARCAPFEWGERGAVIVLHDISELRKLERMRSEFVANVSHELRTPLTSLLGYLETLQDDPWDDEAEARKFIAVCRRQAERLSRIVEDLLRLSRLESPQQMQHAVEIDLGDVINAAMENLKPLAEEHGVTLVAEIGGRRALVLGDRGLLVQALSNLIENSINYNRETGRVTVRLSGASGRAPDGASYQWELAVIDTGIGIPEEARARIFERFYRVDKARSRERGGTGLGLAIVKHIAHAHDATITVDSEVDKGSTFTLRFRKRESGNSSA